MSERQETITDIIAEMRNDANADEYTPDGILGQKLNYIADRLDAAHRREKAAIEADALAVGGIVEAMRQKEVICTKCRDGEPPEDCRFFGEPDGCGSPTYGHYPQLPIGDCAKLREALSDACYAMFNFLKTQYGGYEEMANALDKAKAALAAPPRNCDRPECATLEMATKTWIQEEFGPYCNNSKATMGDIRTFDVWIYAPATENEGGNDGNK